MLIRVEAPWTAAQDQFLERWQADLNYHPYTCAHCRDTLHVEGVLIVTPISLICSTCGYHQHWALLPLNLVTDRQLREYVASLEANEDREPRLLHLMDAVELLAVLNELADRLPGQT